MIALALTAMLLLMLVQVGFLFRVAGMVRRRLGAFIPQRPGAIRELVSVLLFCVMVALVFGAYLFGPVYLAMRAFASALSIPAVELGKFVPVFLFMSLAVLGVCVKLWPKHFAFCGLTTGLTPTRRERRAG